MAKGSRQRHHGSAIGGGLKARWIIKLPNGDHVRGPNGELMGWPERWAAEQNLAVHPAGSRVVRG